LRRLLERDEVLLQAGTCRPLLLQWCGRAVVVLELLLNKLQIAAASPPFGPYKMLLAVPTG
jgi:hypothetical protein